MTSAGAKSANLSEMEGLSPEDRSSKARGYKATISNPSPSLSSP